MLFASIDIGSNAVRLLFANAYKRQGFTQVEKASLIRIPVRLGKDVFKKNYITRTRAEALIKTMKAYKLLIDVYNPVDYVACATAAIREASNGKEVIKRIKKEAGINVKIIDGLEEAKIIRSTNRFLFEENKALSMFIDVGGGSTEISLVSHKKIKDLRSFKIGTIRLLEGKVKKSEWKEMNKWLKQFEPDFHRINPIGSGGNINKIAKIYGVPDSKELFLNELMYAFDHLSGFLVEERMEKLGLRLDRADVIVPAAEIFITILKTIKADKIHVPKIGLADGLIHVLYSRHQATSLKPQATSHKP